MVKSIKRRIRYLRIRLHELKLCLQEFRSGKKWTGDAQQVFFENEMLLFVHSVEKGLGLKDTKPGHSAKEVLNLLDKLAVYMSRGYDIHRFVFKETFRVIMAYVEYQEKFDITEFKAFLEIKQKYDALCGKLGNGYVQELYKEMAAGSDWVNREELLQGKEFDFEKFLSSRHSIRMYENKKIDSELIKHAVKVANMSPSACNRQPNAVYFCNEEQKTEMIDEIISGNRGFKGETKNYIIVTTDRACFANAEQFQWYINGGIYLSYLTLTLHSLGIGCCIMQWQAFYKTENKLKKLLGISSHEAIIAVVSCGYYLENTKCICAQRKDAGETLHII